MKSSSTCVETDKAMNETMKETVAPAKKQMALFERYLTLWVGLCMLQPVVAAVVRRQMIISRMAFWFILKIIRFN